MQVDISHNLARFWGSLFMILGALTVGRGFLGRVIRYTEDHAVTVSTGYITFLLGLMTVVLHNVWTPDWRIAVTVLGWTTLIKGIMKIGFPSRIEKRAKAFGKRQWLWGTIIFLMGAWFFRMGWIP